MAIRYQSRRGGLLIGTINGETASDHFLSRFLEESGFVSTSAGFQMRRITRPVAETLVAEPESERLEPEDNDA